MLTFFYNFLLIFLFIYVIISYNYYIAEKERKEKVNGRAFKYFYGDEGRA